MVTSLSPGTRSFLEPHLLPSLPPSIMVEVYLQLTCPSSSPDSDKGCWEQIQPQMPHVSCGWILSEQSSYVHWLTRHLHPHFSQVSQSQQVQTEVSHRYPPSSSLRWFLPRIPYAVNRKRFPYPPNRPQPGRNESLSPPLLVHRVLYVPPPHFLNLILLQSLLLLFN